MGKKSVWGLYAFILMTSLLALSGEIPVAKANADLEQKIENIEEKKSENERKQKQTEAEKKQLEQKMEEIQAEIEQLDQKLAKTTEDLTEKKSEVSQTEENVNELKQEITALEERIAEREELLKDRVRSMYQNGGTIDYIEVLMGAQSFGDFLDRVAAVKLIAKQDRHILESHKEDQEQLKESKQSLEEQLAVLENQMEELESLKAQQEQQRQEKDQVMTELEMEGHEMEDYLGSLEDEQSLLERQEEAAKQELEEYKRRQQEQANMGQALASSPSDNGASLMRPATGRITSTYGPRWGRMHHGIDFGQGGRSNVPIVAAEAGTVVDARYMSGYGNTIILSHNIEGQQITTLYGHLASSSVSSGDKVKRGEQIGVMGNTGLSTGPHLHFEVHEGNWNGAKSNSVDPMNYID